MKEDSVLAFGKEMSISSLFSHENTRERHCAFIN